MVTVTRSGLPVRVLEEDAQLLGAVLEPVQFKLFLFLSFSNKILHLKDKIFSWWCHTKHECKRVRKVGSKVTPSLSSPLWVGFHQEMCVFYMVHGVWVRGVCQVHMLRVTRAYGRRVNSQIFTSWKRSNIVTWSVLLKYKLRALCNIILENSSCTDYKPA